MVNTDACVKDAVRANTAHCYAAIVSSCRWLSKDQYAAIRAPCCARCTKWRHNDLLHRSTSKRLDARIASAKALNDTSQRLLQRLLILFFASVQRTCPLLFRRTSDAAATEPQHLAPHKVLISFSSSSTSSRSPLSLCIYALLQTVLHWTEAEPGLSAVVDSVYSVCAECLCMCSAFVLQ
jgi:hypothetical protein